MAEQGEEEKGTKGRVMVAIDDSECSRYALEWALDHLADPLAASLPLLLFNVQPFNTLGSISAAAGYGYAHALAAVPPAPELIQSMQEYQRKVALALLESAEKLCAKKGVVVEKITEVGDPKEAICEAVEKFKVNLLIMGSHGRGALQRAGRSGCKLKLDQKWVKSSRREPYGENNQDNECSKQLVRVAGKCSIGQRPSEPSRALDGWF